MIIKNALLIITLLSGFTIYGYGQQYPPQDMQGEIRRQEEANRKAREQRLIQNTMANLDSLQNRNRIYKTVFKRDLLSKEDRKFRDKLVVPDAEDKSLYQDFLKQPNTGIFRLFSDKDCLVNGIVNVDGNCKNIFPNTWYYSFREKDYSDNLFFDLFLRNGKLRTDSLLSQGILVKLGNFSLDKVTLESKGSKFLVDFKPAEKALDIKAQYDQIFYGIESDGYKYSKEVNTKVGEVYLLRVVAYRLQRKFLEQISDEAVNSENLKFVILNQDKRDDVTIAFRIIKADVNGNLTIIWKELERKKSPEAIFPDR